MSISYQEQNQTAVDALNKLLEAAGLTVGYSDSWDGMENGILFYREDGHQIQASQLLDILSEHIIDLEKNRSWDNWNELNVARIQKITEYISEGNTGIASYFIDPYAVISDSVLEDQELHDIFDDINGELTETTLTFEREDFLYGIGTGPEYHWRSMIKIKDEDFTTEQKHKLVQALNWLETYNPNFKESLWHIRQGQVKGNIKHPVIIKYFMDRTEVQNDEIAIGFGPSGYVGTDGKLYQFSLNESIAHEVWHVAQESDPGYSSHEKFEQEALEQIRKCFSELESYFKEKGMGAYQEYKNYLGYIRTASEVDFDQKLDSQIIQDPVFRNLAQNYLGAHLHYQDLYLALEDDAMDHVTGLRALLGKPPRGHYHDSSLFNDDIQELLGDAIVYTSSPEAIRNQGHERYDLKDLVATYGMITGRVGPGGLNSMLDIQQNWIDQWDSDTKNITEDEWRIVQDAKRQMFSEGTFDITISKKSKLDALTNKLMEEFNVSSGFDQPSQQIDQAFKDIGITLKF